MFAPFLQKHAVKSPTLLRAVSWALWFQTMKKLLLILISVLVLAGITFLFLNDGFFKENTANKKVIHNTEDCPPIYYSGDLSEIVDIEIPSPYTSENSDYKYDMRINFFPKQGYRDLEFYGGGIQHGYPHGIFSVMNFIETDESLYAWILATKNTLDTIKIRLWFSNASCHMAAVFMLSENEDIAELLKLKK
jgi:hypothetical protein